MERTEIILMAQMKTAHLPRKYRNTVEQLYKEHKDLMLHVAMKVVNNEDQAKDIVHSSFLRIIKHIKKIKPMSPKETKGYIIFIVKNLALDFIGMYEYKKTVPLDDFEPHLKYSSNPTAKNAIMNLDISDVMETLEKLDSKYSLPVFHRYVLGYSISEIAKMLDITIPNAKVRCHRGRLKLVDLIKEGENHE